MINIPCVFLLIFLLLEIYAIMYLVVTDFIQLEGDLIYLKYVTFYLLIFILLASNK